MTDITLAETHYLMFTTRAFATGIPTALAGSPVVSAYENDSATQITAGITLGVDHDSVAGLNLLTVVATGANGYEAGKKYNLVITTGTVGGVSVVGEVVGSFSIESSAAFTRLGAPAGASVSADIAAIEAQTDDIGAAGAGLTAVPWNASWDAEVQSEVADALAVFWTSPATLVDLVWDEPTSGHATAGTTGKALTDAGSAGDPWSTALPGAYGAGTAGEILGDWKNGGRLDLIVDDILADTAVIGAAGAGLTALATQASVNTIDDFLDTEIAAIKTKTDFLPSVAAGDAGGLFIAGTNAATTITTSLTTTFTGNLTGSVGSVTGAVGSVTGAVGSVTGNVGGDVVGSVGSLVGHTVQTGDTYALASGATGFAAIDAVVDAILVDTGTTLDAALAVVDANVDIMRAGIITGTAATGTLSTTVCTSSLTGYTDDQLIGRIITFYSGPADGESSDITDYASASGTITFTALTLAPQNGDTFKIT